MSLFAALSSLRDSGVTGQGGLGCRGEKVEGIEKFLVQVTMHTCL